MLKLPEKKYEPKHNSNLKAYAIGWNAVIYNCRKGLKYNDEMLKKYLMELKEAICNCTIFPYYKGEYDCILEIEKLNKKPEHRLDNFFKDSLEALDKLNIRGEQKKAVLVIDVGEENIDDLRASITIHPKDYSKSLFTLINCSLKPLPKKLEENTDDEYDYEWLYKRGYNDCLNKILGEK